MALRCICFILYICASCSLLPILILSLIMHLPQLFQYQLSISTKGAISLIRRNI